ncbi:MAG: CPBP family intramembrane metalloprotease [Clostridia bacterium]|nr:CPBP family intramembrane metalloprotease [Clostridia bacterium]
MSNKRFKVSIIYFVVVILTLLMRVASALDIYSALGIDDADAFWSCMVQIVIFGVVPFVMYLLMVAGREERFLPYFPRRKKKEKKQDEQQSEQQDEIARIFEDQDLAPVVQEQDFQTVGFETEFATQEEASEATPADLISTEQKPESKAAKFGKKLKALFKDFGFKRVSFSDSLRTIVLAVCMVIIGTGVSVVWQTVLSLIGYTRVSSHTDYDNLVILFKELALVAVLPGLFEEFSHRGLLYAGYKETGWKFVLISSMFFSLMHQNIVQTGYTFVDGVAMALVMYYTGSIWPGMFMHFFNNFWSVLLGYVEQNGGALAFINTIYDWLFSTVLGLLVGILAVLVAIALAVIMLVFMRRAAVKKGRIDSKPFKNTMAYPVLAELMFWLTIAVGVAATAFSFVWGMIR